MKHPFDGIHPAKHCLARLLSAPAELERLLKCSSAPQGLKDSAAANHTQWMKKLEADVASSALWEIERYGCLLIEDVTPWNATRDRRGKGKLMHEHCTATIPLDDQNGIECRGPVSVQTEEGPRCAECFAEFGGTLVTSAQA